jgi:hypothetical protein
MTIDDDIQKIKDEVDNNPQVSTWDYFSAAARIKALTYVKDNWPKALFYKGGSAHMGISKGVHVHLNGIGSFTIMNGIPDWEKHR